MKKSIKRGMKCILVGLYVVGFFTFGVYSAWAGPGLLQMATRPGFWANDFPEGPLLLQHLYCYQYDKTWDDDGHKQDSQDTTVTASFTRIINVKHFGEDNKFQYVVEGIVPLYNVSVEESSSGAGDNFSISGMGHPFIYNALGWNNPTKTTHLTGYVLAQIPLGDSDIMEAMGSNSYALEPGIAMQQRLGNFWIEGTVGYMFNFEDIDSDAKAGDSFEVNMIATQHFSATYPWWIYVQADYIHFLEDEDDNGNDLGNDGYNYTIAPGIGIAVRPTITLDIKYAMDIDGENTAKGQAINFRLLWKF